MPTRRMMRLRSSAAAAIAMIAAAVCVPASARAGSVLLWVCHGPNGEPLGAAPLFSTWARDGRALASGAGCDGVEGTGGLLATLSRPDPLGGSSAGWQVSVPVGVTLDSLRIARTTSGFGGAPIAGDPQRYRAETSTTGLESAAVDDSSNVPLGGVLTIAPATGQFVRLSVACGASGSERCAPPSNGTVGVTVSSLALGVVDEVAPVGAVGGVQSPIDGALHLQLYATDVGAGLAAAEATIDGRPTSYVRLGTGSCPEHPSPSSTANLPLGAGDCPESVAAVPMSVDPGGEGTHTLRVTVTDAAGNTATLIDETIVVARPAPSSNTVTLGIGNPGSGGGTSSASGGVLGSSTGNASASGTPSNCVSPMLSMHLASKPLRYAKHHVPVLRYRHRYTYKGTLTCLSSGRRVSAPKGTVVQVLNTVGRRTFKSGRGTMTVHRGMLRALLGYTSARTIVFRYRPTEGGVLQVKIQIAIAKRHPKPRKRR